MKKKPAAEGQFSSLYFPGPPFPPLGSARPGRAKRVIRSGRAKRQQIASLQTPPFGETNGLYATTGHHGKTDNDAANTPRIQPAGSERGFNDDIDAFATIKSLHQLTFEFVSSHGSARTAFRS